MIEVCSQEKFVDLEEFGRVLSMTIYNKKEFKAICNIVNRYIYENKIRDLSKHNKEKLLAFALTDEKFQRIVKRNIDNISEMENHFEDEINYNCVFNLKKSKLNNYDETGVIPIEYERLEHLLQIRDDCIVEKKVNLNRGFISKENSSEEEAG